MKKTYLLLLFTTFYQFSFAQSGLLEPTGFSIPKVAALATCNGAAKGKMVFQTTDNKLYICNGAAWQGPSEFSIPYTTTASSNAGGLFNLTNSGTSWVMNTAISNIFNNTNTIISYTAGTGSAGYFYTSNVSGHAFKTYGALNFDNIGHAAGKILTSDASGNATWNYQSQVAFSVTSDHSYYVGQNTYIKINYTAQDYDLGGNISLSTDTFVAPYNGIYHFDAAIKAEPGGILDWGGIYYGLSLWKNGVKLAETFSDIEVTVSVTFSKDVKLNAQDEIQMKIYWHDGYGLNAEYIPIYEDHTYNYFNGHLVTRTN